MKFGIVYANAGAAGSPDNAVEFARFAEEAGYESLWTVEHVVVPADYVSAYPYSESGKMPGTEESPIPDPLAWLSFVAGATRTINLATGILILPQRNPVILAKEAATLDALSGGRLILGIGVGWLREEFAALGIPFDERAARADEYIEVMRSLWTEDETSFKGDFVSLERAKCFPKPFRTTGVPIVVGGHSAPAARRAGRLGNGFFPARTTPEDLATLLDVMKVAAKDAGRDPDAIEVTAGGAIDVDTVRRFEDLGVSRIVVPPLGRDLESIKSFLGQFSDEVLSRLA